MSAARQTENSFDVIMSLLVKHCTATFHCLKVLPIYKLALRSTREKETLHTLYMNQENKEVNVLVLKILKLKTYENQPKHKNRFAIKNPSQL